MIQRTRGEHGFAEIGGSDEQDRGHGQWGRRDGGKCQVNAM
jgi:hypothetical protein